MARIRSFKPEYFTHPILGRLSAEVRLMGLGLISMADDEGFFRADPALVRASIDPFRESLASISDDLAKLSAIGFIEVRVHPVQGPIGRVAKWSIHQKVDHPNPSKIKVYFLANDSRAIREDTGTDPEPFASDQGSRIRDQGSGSTPPPPKGEPAAAEVKPRKRTKKPDHLSEAEATMRDLWNAKAEALGLVKAMTSTEWLSGFRESFAKAGWWDSVPKALEGLDADPFYRGQNQRGWKATLEWFCRDGKLDELLAKAEKAKLGRETNLNRSLTQAEADKAAQEQEALFEADMERAFGPKEESCPTL